MSSLAQVRIDADLSIEAAASRAGISVDYLRRIERGGGCAYPLAGRIARLYGCNLNTFLTKPGQSRRPNTKEIETPRSRANVSRA